MHRSEFRFAISHANADNEVTLYRSEILPQSKISNRFHFGSRVNVLLDDYLHQLFNPLMPGGSKKVTHT